MKIFKDISAYFKKRKRKALYKESLKVAKTSFYKDEKKYGLMKALEIFRNITKALDEAYADVK